MTRHPADLGQHPPAALAAFPRGRRDPDTDFRNLELIPARTIHHIRILTGIEGTTYYGTGAEGGVILVYTKTGQES